MIQTMSDNLYEITQPQKTTNTESSQQPDTQNTPPLANMPPIFYDWLCHDTSRYICQHVLAEKKKVDKNEYSSLRFVKN